jgi:energy-coupling factor transporter ATP-binding protein EcfA2
MSLEDEVVDWASSRPTWQRAVLGRLARGESLGPSEYKEIAAKLASGRTQAAAPLSTADLPGAGLPRRQVRLRSVQAIAHVNALVGGQTLTFGREGLTVVYGDNASGKSGYARLIKGIVRARHQEAVLTNIFVDRGRELPEAIVVFEVNGDGKQEQWPGHRAAELSQVGFYDEACGDAYITADSEITYRPSALFLFDGLIRSCDGVRAALDDLLTANALARTQLPEVPIGTKIADFVASLSGDTTEVEIDAACAIPDAAADRAANLAQEEARLRASDPEKERGRLVGAALKLEALACHVANVEGLVGATAERHLRATRDRARELRAAADIASSTNFESEPVPGTGTETWRALWEAARRFSEEEAYRGQPFPVVTRGVRCVLCQQELSEEAAARFAGFQAYMRDETERHAQEAEHSLQQLVTGMRALTIIPAEVAVNMAALETADAQLIAVCREGLSVLEQRREALLEWVDGTGIEAISIDAPSSPEDGLRSAEARLRQEAKTIDASWFEEMVRAVTARRVELLGRMAIAGARRAVMEEVQRRRSRTQLETAKRLTDTTGITRKATELVRAHVTAVVRDRFTRESDRLRLERITLQDTGGHKGQLFQRPAFLGAAQHPEMRQVLSQGEQTALGLAGYLTEAHFDESRSSMVLDDPVSSLDHIRRGRVARRLAEFAKDRQVIVLTHEITFVGDLRKAAELEDIPFSERSIERRGDGSPGMCLDQYPWKARDVRERLGELTELLARIKRARPNWQQETYEKESAEWAGKLSETWERMINIEIVNQVVDRGTSEVRPKKFRLLARITDDDDREFQGSYARCSQWARRHDKSPEINYVPPEIGDMEKELMLVRKWFDRIRKYSD